MIAYIVADLTNPGDGEPFCVIRVDTDIRSGNGVEGIVQSKHWTRAEAEQVAASFYEPAASALAQ